MAIDQSIVVYPRTDTVEMDDGRKRTFTRPTRDELSEVNGWWQSRLEKHKKKSPKKKPQCHR